VTATATAPATTVVAPPPRTRRALWRSPSGQPRWARPALFVLAALAAAAYAWGARNGQVHGYYAPAVKSMSESWRAFFYGGYDPAASITLDKLPGAFQVEALSARIFGFSTWSVLLPQVVETALAVLALYSVVRRWMGPVAGLVAAAAFATTPIVAALAHAEIADTLLILLLILAAQAWQRAVAGGRLGWLVLSGAWVGLAFQVKMVQAWGVLPALAIGYLLAAPGRLPRRLGHVGLAGLATLAVSLSWITMVQLTPASARPYVDGSLNNSPFAMVFQYNLLSRYGMGSDTQLGTPGPGGGGALSFMVSDSIAPQVGWLYPLAVIGLVAGVWWRGRAPRTDVVRAGFLMWALWLAVHAVAFSTGRVAHSFYVVAVAPAVAALAGGGLVALWRAFRRGGRQRWVLPVALLASVAWAVYLSGRFPTFLPWLRPVLVVLGVVGVALLVAVATVRGRRRLRARLALTALVAVLAALFVAPTAWAMSTTDSRYSGSSIGPAAGPRGEFGPGGAGPAGGRGGPADGRGGFGPNGQPGAGGLNGQPGAGGLNGLPGAGPGAGANGGGRPRGGTGQALGSPDGQAQGGRQFPGGGPGSAGGAGGGGVLGGSAEPTAQAKQLVAWLKAHQPGSRYLVAVQGSMQAGEYILAGASVLPIGGFSGQVPFPTTDQLAKLVADGQVRYVLAGGGMGGGRGARVNSAATQWATSNCTAVNDSTLTVSGLYDCRAN
jgi:4-amino-4-deoxy-L-arabinose transferase-like glycosyltransferase